LLLRSAFSAALIQLRDRSRPKATCTVWLTTVAQNSRTFYWPMLDKQTGHCGRRERGIIDYGPLKTVFPISSFVVAGLWSAIVPTNAQVNVSRALRMALKI
jgi:hypothetical protein